MNNRGAPAKSVYNQKPAAPNAGLPASVQTPQQALAYMKRGQTAYLKQHPPLHGIRLAQHIVDPVLSAAGLKTTHQLGQTVLHPLAAAELKGQFSPKASGAHPLPGLRGPHGEPLYSSLEIFPSPSRATVTKAVQAAEDAATSVSEAARAAKAQGHGVRASTPVIPKVEPGAVTPQTGGEAGAQVRAGLKGAPKVRSEQQAGYSAERARRAGRLGPAAENAGGGVGGYHAALSELKGELPKLDFQGFKNFDQDALVAMLNHVQAHPVLRPYEKIGAQKALLDAAGGKVPTASQQRLLERAFGREVGAQIKESVPFWKRSKHVALEVLNIPRAVMASADLSAPFRQGLMVAASHPVIFAKNLGPMVKAFGSERVYQELMHNVYERETFPLMEKAKLAITDIGQLDQGVPLEQREEQFMSNYAEHLHELPGIRRTPIKYPLAGVSHVVRSSDRAYTGFLNKTRADVFDHLVHQAAKQGVDLNDQHAIESIARFVNSATGRGDLGYFQKHAAALNTLFFSPKLLASRLNFLNPIYYLKLDPFARKEALKAALGFVGLMASVLEIAKLGGAKVGTDPRSADFAKIRIGNTRVDIAGGFQQPVRLLAQLQQSKVVSSVTGKTLTLGPQGPGKLSERDIIQRFFEAKLAPVPSFVNDKLKGTDFQGNKFSWTRETYQRMIPLLAQDAADLYRQEGPAAALAGYGIGAFGIGFQTYGPKPVKGGPANYGGSSGSSNSGYAGSGSGGGSAYAGG